MSGLYEHVVNYCERTDHSFWSEPVNAISNLAFLIAAWLAFRLYKTHGKPDRPALALIILIAVVGVGSFIFHTFATTGAMLCDVIPIVVFVAYYIYVSFTRLLGWKPLGALLVIVGFVAFGAYSDALPAPYNLNGSIAYLPCLAIIIFIGRKLKMRAPAASHVYFNTALMFAASLTFRTIDRVVCSAIPLGTHFLWHCLNGVVLYLLVKALLAAEKPAN